MDMIKKQSLNYLCFGGNTSVLNNSTLEGSLIVMCFQCSWKFGHGRSGLNYESSILTYCIIELAESIWSAGSESSVGDSCVPAVQVVESWQNTI